MQVSPCQPRSAILSTATAMPALILSALKPGGSDGSEKSTVSGFWPTNKIRVMRLILSKRSRLLPLAFFLLYWQPRARSLEPGRTLCIELDAGEFKYCAKLRRSVRALKADQAAVRK